MKEIIEKRKSHAFGRDIYLLGIDSNGEKYWLESPSFDCGRYWGFGYVETYTHRNPKLARDISSHQHIDSSFLGKQGKEYIRNLYDSPILQKTTFTEKEGWQLSELFKQFYLLKNMADFTYREKPNCNVTVSPVDHGNMKDWNKKINEEMIPRITKAILDILSPEE